MPKKRGSNWRKDHDTDHARLQRNYTASEEMLHELRKDTDFSEHAQHDSNELRPEAHHNYNEAALEDDAFHTNLHGHGHKHDSTKTSSRRGTPSRSPGPRASQRKTKSQPKSPSPAPPSNRARKSGQSESTKVKGDAKQSTSGNSVA